MSSNANSDRDDQFFSAPGEEDKPKAPGSFTRSFMSSGSDADTPAPFDPKAIRSSPFTAQFGTESAFIPVPDGSSPSSLPELAPTGSQQLPPAGASFTKMFGSQTPAENQSSAPAGEVTRVFDRPTRGAIPTPQPAPRSSGFTDMFGSPQSLSPVPEPKKPLVAAAPAELKPSGFTEMFKSPAQPAPGVESPVSPLSAQPGRFTEMFKGPSLAPEPKPVAAPTPFSGSGAGGFTEFFKTPTSVPASPAPAMPTPSESAPGGFTQLFKGSMPPKPSPVSPKPAGELTRMISGSELSPQAPTPGVPNAGATRLFNEPSAAPAMAPLPPGPSEYTRIVSPRQLKDLLQMPANSAAPAAATQAPGALPIPAWPAMAAPPAIPGATPPQLATPPMPQAAPAWQPPQVQPPAPFVMQAPQVPTLPTAPPVPVPAPVPKTESKLVTYLPLIIGLNVLFLIAVLLILLFALKR